MKVWHTRTVLSLAAATGAAWCGMVRAADLPPPPPAEPVAVLAPPPAFFVHLGPGALFLDAGAEIYTPAGRVPGATIRIQQQVTALAEVGYFVTPEWAVAATVGVPPTAKIEGDGTVSGLGKLGSVLYGPVAATVQYHFRQFGMFQPYLGIGPTYEIAFRSHDSALSDLDVHSAWGGVVQGGVDLMVTDRIGVFVDLKKAYLRTEATGRLGAVPIRSDVKLDPLVFSGGLTLRF